MIDINNRLSKIWAQLGPDFLPFADAASAELPLGRLLRLSLFQVSVGMAIVLMIGTLNRVMIVELHVPAWLVSVMISLPVILAPARALVGYKSDHHRSVLGWRRVPYLWMGSLLQFGGLAIMPFALILLSGDTTGPAYVGQAGAALAFLLVGAGLHTSQTAGLALATDLAPVENHPRVVALLCIMLLLGMVVSALGFGAFLSNFSELRLIQTVQGAAVLTIVLNSIALWKQEARNSLPAPPGPAPRFADALKMMERNGQGMRRMIAIGLGTIGFSMQDILLEPYGGEILGLSVGATTLMTAALGAGGVAAFVMAERWLRRDIDPYRLAGFGVVAGMPAFAAIIFAAPLDSALLFAMGTGLIGFGGGLFAVGSLTAFMRLANNGQSGLALGMWGAVQASAAGGAAALGGILRDVVGQAAANNVFGAALNVPEIGYCTVYHLEIALLFATLIALGPLVRGTHFVPAYRTQTFNGGVSAYNYATKAEVGHA